MFERLFLGTDLGGAVKGFKEGMKTEDDKNKPEIPPSAGATIEGEARKETTKT